MRHYIDCLTGKYGIVNSLQLIIYSIPLLFLLVVYFLLRGENKRKLNQDIERFWECTFKTPHGGHVTDFIVLMSIEKSMRNVFYMRLGLFGFLVKWILPGVKPFNMATKSANIGGGLFIQHGYATDINAKFVGENLWINQRATIGWTAKGQPTIGDNVTIGVGAVVLGPVKIGNNVNIGANAIVVEDIPDNVTVCSPKAKIVKYHDGEPS